METPHRKHAVPTSARAGGVLLALAAPTPALAAEELAVATMTLGIVGGLALFLLGMELLASGLKTVAGRRMKAILAQLTTTPLRGALTGAFVTAVIQSSSVTTTLVVGFISAGLMGSTQSIGVIMGANVGTTVTAQIVAFKVTKAAQVLLAVGFVLAYFVKHERARRYGQIILGLGMVFYGMNAMGDAMAPLRHHAPFVAILSRLADPLTGIALSAAFTAAVQSSSATTGIAIVMAGQGIITLPAGIALIFGANVGTCITALLASAGKPRAAVRSALVHVLFNVGGVLLWFGFIEHLASLAVWLSPRYPDLAGSSRLAAEVPRQIANAHTLFNVANTALFLAAAGPFSRLVHWLLPDRPQAVSPLGQPRYLDEGLLTSPALALEAVRMEFLRLGDIVLEILRQALPTVLGGSAGQLAALAQRDEEVDQLHRHLLDYLGKISGLELTEQDAAALIRLMSASDHLESVGDIVETNLVALGQRRLREQVTVSAATGRLITEFHRSVLRDLEQAVHAVGAADAQAAQQVIAEKASINQLADRAAQHQAQRLIADAPNRLGAYTFETDVVHNLKRIYYLAKRAAKTVQPPPAAAPAEAAPPVSPPSTPAP